MCPEYTSKGDINVFYSMKLYNSKNTKHDTSSFLLHWNLGHKSSLMTRHIKYKVQDTKLIKDQIQIY